jgi:hypothetical protein
LEDSDVNSLAASTDAEELAGVIDDDDEILIWIIHLAGQNRITPRIVKSIFLNNVANGIVST